MYDAAFSKHEMFEDAFDLFSPKEVHSKPFDRRNSRSIKLGSFQSSISAVKSDGARRIAFHKQVLNSQISQSREYQRLQALIAIRAQSADGSLPPGVSRAVQTAASEIMSTEDESPADGVKRHNKTLDHRRAKNARAKKARAKKAGIKAKSAQKEADKDVPKENGESKGIKPIWRNDHPAIKGSLRKIAPRKYTH